MKKAIALLTAIVILTSGIPVIHAATADSSVTGYLREILENLNTAKTTVDSTIPLADSLASIEDAVTTQEIISTKFSDLSWNEIATIAREGRINEYQWKVGDEKDGFRIIGINQDNPCTDSGTPLVKGTDYKDVITLMTTTSYGSYKYNTSDSNVGSWQSCRIRTVVMPAYFAALPIDLQAVIGPVKKISGTCNNTATGGPNQTTVDKCFLLAEGEIFNVRTQSLQNEFNVMQRYQYFANGGDTNLAVSWWERAASILANCRVCIVINGKGEQGCAVSVCEVFPAFCIY